MQRELLDLHGLYHGTYNIMSLSFNTDIASLHSCFLETIVGWVPGCVKDREKTENGECRNDCSKRMWKIVTTNR